MSRYKKIKLKDGSTIDEHRLIMQNSVGRKLTSNECVHHEDEDTHNNQLSNLKIFTRAKHLELHRKNYKKTVLSEKQKNEIRKRFSKLTEKQVIEVLNSNEKSSELVKKYKVSRFVINRVRVGKSWPNLYSLIKLKDRTKNTTFENVSSLTP